MFIRVVLQNITVIYDMRTVGAVDREYDYCSYSVLNIKSVVFPSNIF